MPFIWLILSRHFRFSLQWERSVTGRDGHDVRFKPWRGIWRLGLKRNSGCCRRYVTLVRALADHWQMVPFFFTKAIDKELKSSLWCNSLRVIHQFCSIIFLNVRVFVHSYGRCYPRPYEDNGNTTVLAKQVVTVVTRVTTFKARLTGNNGVRVRRSVLIHAARRQHHAIAYVAVASRS